MKKGLILINAYTRILHALEQAQRLKDELNALGVAADVRRNDFFAAYTDDCGKIVSAADGYDFCIYLDKDKYVSHMLEKAGLKLFNSHAAVQDCDDKMTTFIRLAGAGIAMPKTLAGFLCYTPEAEIEEETLARIERELGYPVVLKTAYGSLGKGVRKADDRAELSRILREWQFTPHLYQGFIAESAGKDLRVIVIGGKTVAAMKRVSHGDFRSNIELGGTGEKSDAPPEAKALCEKAARVLGLDFCGIDLLFGKDGFLLCEVNSNAFFGGIEKATGVNVARLYAEHILKNV